MPLSLERYYINIMSRGRGISNEPAWMTRGEHGREPAPPSRDRDSYRRNRDSQPPYRGSRPYHHGRNYDRRDRRGPPPRRKNDIIFNSYEEELAWVQDRRRKRRERPSLFDVEPTEEQITLEELQKAALASHGPNPNVFLKPEQRQLAQESMNTSNAFNLVSIISTPQANDTKHARTLLIGNLPNNVSEEQLKSWLRSQIFTAMNITSFLLPKDDPIASVSVQDSFAIVEFQNMDVCTACLALNGISFQNQKLTLKRPKDYMPSRAPALNVDFMYQFDVAKLGIVSYIVLDTPNRVLISGIPVHLNEEQVMQLLSAFGKLKAFHLVKDDVDATTSKGYCFVEYTETHIRDMAIAGLNGMEMGGGKVLTAKLASERREGEGAEIGSAVIAGTQVTTSYSSLSESTTSGGIGSSVAPPIMRYVDGMDVEALVDFAMGNSTIGKNDGNGSTKVASKIANNALDIANAALEAVYGSSNPGPSANGRSDAARQTRILVLHNMVTDEDFASKEDYEGLKEEVREECEKFGQLISMKIPHPKVSTFSNISLRFYIYLRVSFESHYFIQ